MANKDPKPVLGYIECDDCGERGSVHQAARRGNHLYKRCGCGCDQRNGDRVQSILWYETAWLDGLKPEKPVNVWPLDRYQQEFQSVVVRSTAVPGDGQEPEKPEPVEESESVPAQQSETDFNPDATDIESHQAERKKSRLLWPAVATVALGGLAWLASAAAKVRG